MTQGFSGFFLLLGGSYGCGEGPACRVGAGPGFRCVLFLSANHYKNQRLNSIKIKVPCSFCGKSV